MQMQTRDFLSSQNDGANMDGAILIQTLRIYEMKAFKYTIIFLLLSS